MAITEEGLRKRIGSEALIGCFHIADDGQAYFDDIRGEEGDLVQNPLTKAYDIRINCSYKNLDEGQFYLFPWRLDESTQEFIITGVPTLVDNNALIAKIYDARLRLSGSSLVTFNNFQKTIFNEVTGAQHTFIYELLQNANDYPYNKEQVKVQFIVSDHYLFFFHSGAAFNLRNIVGISDINQGEKTDNTETIGYKGIGFKTVFVNNEYVYLKSGDWQLRFDRKYSEEQASGECPWALMPIPTKEFELDAEARTIIDGSDMRVRFALRHKRDASENIPQLDKVFHDNQILLFIPHIHEVEVIVGGETRYHIEKDERRWVVNDFLYPVPEELQTWVNKNINSGDKIPEKFKNIKNVKISFAVGRNENLLEKVEDAKVYNYLPTELDLGFNFLFNADFVPNGSRSGLHDVEWNRCIMKQCGVKFADWWTGFMKNEGEYDLTSVFALLPDLVNRSPYGSLFIEGFKERIQEIPCVPTKRDGEYRLVKLEDVVYDRTGLMESCNPILSEDDFYEFTDTTGCLPVEAIREDENLNRLIDKFNTSIKFSYKELEQLCDEYDFRGWLQKRENNVKFLSFLLTSDYLNNVRRYPIFLQTNGKLGKACDMYFDIDKYAADISFLSSNLPILDVEIRRSLEEKHAHQWRGIEVYFKHFNTQEFTQSVLARYHSGELTELFHDVDNSRHFLHFIASCHDYHHLPEVFELLTDDGEWTNDHKKLYVKDDVGVEIVGHEWIDNAWVKFLSPAYLAEDEETIMSFFSSPRINITTLSDKLCYQRFIKNEDKIPFIAEKIKDVEVNKDFYHYLFQHSDCVTEFTREMRLSYYILTTDGKETTWTTINNVIFSHDEEWQRMASTSWMPGLYCLAIDSTYFGGMGNDEFENFLSFLTRQSIVQRFSLPALYQNIRSRFKEIFANITTQETSRDFLDFLFKCKENVRKTDNNQDLIRQIPLKIQDREELVTIEDIGRSVYLMSAEAKDLYEQPWFNKSNIYLCDDCYADVFDGKERTDFFISLGLKSFDKLHYLRAHLLRHLDDIRENVMDRANNLSFHHYLADLHESLSERDLEGVKGLPIYLSSPENENGVLTDSSSDHYLPNELLTDIVKRDIVPVDILDTIHADYIRNEKDKKYFVDKLGNSEISSAGFFGYIVAAGEDVYDYLLDENRNVRFWRWVCDSNVGKEAIEALNVFPMIGRSCSDTENRYLSPKELYISGEYTQSDGLEGFINEYVNEPCFVSPVYREEGTNRNWRELFANLGMTVDYLDIILSKIIPQLARYYNTQIVATLAPYTETFIQRMNLNSSKLKEQFGQLRLLCEDGLYRMPNECIVSGAYFDITEENFKEIALGKLVSEQYLTDAKTPEQQRQIKKFITFIADRFCTKAETATQLRDMKIKYFLEHQHEFTEPEIHFVIIRQLCAAYVKDTEGIFALFKEGKSLLVYTTKDELQPINSLYLSSAFTPNCDFMANGIEELSYVSEQYAVNDVDNCAKSLFRSLGCNQYFTEANLVLLSNIQFATYFWEVHAPSNEYALSHICTADNIWNVVCVPTVGGVKKPCQLYDYRNQQLQKMVLQLPGGEEKIPSVKLPEWATKIGLHSRLSFPDCLEYLMLDNTDYRRDVLRWITETKDETISRYKSRIESYHNQANWLCGTKVWKPLRELVALEWGNKTLKGNFGGNAFVCSPSYMPESQQDYNRLCDTLGIKILHDADFTKKKRGECYEDEKAVQAISLRLKYLAYKTGRADWQELYNSYASKLHRADVSVCEHIDYYYNENIHSELRVYAETADDLWYKGTWKGSMFLAVLEWIKSKLEIKGDFDDNYLSDLFLTTPFSSFVQDKEGGKMPKEFLETLTEQEAEGIEEDSMSEGESFDETNVSTESEAPNAEELLERRSRSPRTSRLSGKNDNDDDSYRDKHEETSDNAPMDDEQRFEENWDRMKQRKLGRPSSPQSSSIRETPYTEERRQHHPDMLPNVSENDIPSMPESADPMRRAGQNIMRKSTEAANNAKTVEDQKTMLDILYATPKYTFKWFKYLMGLTLGEKSDGSTKKAQIDFKGYDSLDTPDMVRLMYPSTFIPQWIADADAIKVTIFGDKQTSELSVSIVLLSDEYVDVAMPEEMVKKVTSARTVRINAECTNNIYTSLQTRFLQLDLPDDYDLNLNLPKEIEFIYGPPGTGKTTRLAERLYDIITAANDNVNILVLTPTNKAADVISEMLVNNDETYRYLSRFGITESEYLVGEGVVRHRDNMDMTDNNKNIVVMTATRFSYDCVQPDNTMVCDFPWDYIVVDEASMIDITTITFILHKGTGAQFIIAGDPKQIQPVPQNDIPMENIYQMVGLDSFRNASQSYSRFKVETLNVQHRAIPAIGDLVSRFSYDGLVKNDPQRNTPKPLRIGGLDVQSINMIGFPTIDFDDLYQITKIDTSAFHLYAALFTYNMVDYCIQEICKNHPKEHYAIGIVSPYRAEADAIKQLLDNRPLDNANCTVTSGTVHKFQGDECDLMFVILNPPVEMSVNSHINNMNIMNVAMSRARDYLFFIMPEDYDSKFVVKLKLGHILNGKKCLKMKCSEVEKVMFSNSHYIKDNTEVSCHLPVNVYYESQAKYDVHISDTNIDIQINEK